MSLTEVVPRRANTPREDTIRLIESGEAERWSTEKILTWSIRNYHPYIALSASFGAPEGMVLLDMMHAIEPASRVFVLDTGRLHQETHDLIDRVRDRYGKSVEVLFPDALALQRLVSENGMNSFYESLERRKLCCQIRKVDPMRRYLENLDAYVTGVRRDQTVTRSETPKIAIDDAYGGVVKVNPIADWDADRVWQYVRKHKVPVNRLHKSGYPSVGCVPCTRSIRPGDDPRSGRWWWENADTRECGLHDSGQEQGSGI